MKKLLALIMMTALFFSGCNGKELNQKMIVLGMGIDFSEENYLVTAVYINTESADGKEKYQTKFGRGKTITQAVNNIATQNGLEVMYSHMSFILFGKTVCQHGLNDTLQFFSGYYQCRPSADILVCNHSAKNILADKKITPEQINRLAQSHTVTGVNRTLPFYRFYADILNPSVSACTSLITQKNDDVNSQGVAVFHDDTFAYSLNDEETLGLLLVSENPSSEVIPITESHKSFSLSDKKTDFSVWWENNTLYCDVTVSATVSFYEYEENPQLLEKSVEKKLQKLVQNTLKKSLQHGDDIFYLTKKLRQKNKQVYYSIKDWQSVLKDTVFTVHCHVSVR